MITFASLLNKSIHLLKKRKILQTPNIKHSLGIDFGITSGMVYYLSYNITSNYRHEERKKKKTLKNVLQRDFS